jgi:hypothetical protein
MGDSTPTLPSPTRYQIRLLPAADPRGVLVVELTHHPERVRRRGGTLEALLDWLSDLFPPEVEYLEIRAGAADVRVLDADGHRRREAVAVAYIAQVLADAGKVVLVLNDGSRAPLVLVDPAAASAAADAIARYLDRLNAPPPPPLPHVDCTRCSNLLELVDADRERLTLDCSACGAIVDVSRHAELLRTLPPRVRWRRRRREPTPAFPDSWTIVVEPPPPAFDAPHRATPRRGTLRVRTPQVGRWRDRFDRIFVGALLPSFELEVDDDELRLRDRDGERRIPLAEIAQLDGVAGELAAITRDGLRIPLVRSAYAAAIEALVERHLGIDDAELLA